MVDELKQLSINNQHKISSSTSTSASSSSSTFLFIEFTYYYVLPFVSLTGFLLEMISVIVFLKIINLNSSIRMTNIYKYLLIYSISDSCSLVVLSFIGFLKCGHYCSHLDKVSSMSKQYELYFYLFINNIFSTFSELIEFKIAFDRYMTIFKRKRPPPTSNSGGSEGIGSGFVSDKYNSKITRIYFVVISFFLLSILSNIPYLYMYNIVSYKEDELNSDNLVYYKLELTNQISSNNQIAHNSYRTFLLFKDIFLLIVIVTINLLMAFTFKRRFEQLRQFNKSISSNKNEMTTISTLLTTLHSMNNISSQHQTNQINNLQNSSQNSSTEKLNNKQDMITNESNNNKLSGYFGVKLFKKYTSSQRSQNPPHSSISSSISPHHVSKRIMKKYRYELNGPSTCSTTKILNNYNVEKRVTFMIIFLCMIYLLGHIPETVYKFKTYLSMSGWIHFNYLPEFHLFVDIMAISTRGLNFFIYLKFNFLFKSTFKNLFRL
jgi:hypothetical protein